MALLPAMVIAAGFGALVRFLAPHRDSYGVLVTGATAAAATAVVWSLLLFTGITAAEFWLWLISIAVGALSAAAVALLLGSRRPQRDQERLAELMRRS